MPVIFRMQQIYKFLLNHLGPHLADALISSPVIQGEDGTGAIGLGAGGFEFVDPNEDPELALVSQITSLLIACRLLIIDFSGFASLDGGTASTARR